MVSNVRPTGDLTEDEIQRVYEIYRFAFGKTLKSRSFDEFRNFLAEPYCYTGSKKFIQTFGCDSNIIRGYTILIEPLFLKNKEISKIIQSAVCNAQPYQRNSIFLSMIKELILWKKSPDRLYVAEIGVDYPAVRRLYIRAGFHTVYDKTLAADITRGLLGKHQFELIEDNRGLVVSRETIFHNNYKAYLLVNYG